MHAYDFLFKLSYKTLSSEKTNAAFCAYFNSTLFILTDNTN